MILMSEEMMPQNKFHEIKSVPYNKPLSKISHPMRLAGIISHLLVCNICTVLLGICQLWCHDLS